MRNHRLLQPFIITITFALFAGLAALIKWPGQEPVVTTEAPNAYGQIPLSFEAHDDARFIARGAGYSIRLGANEAIMRLRVEDRGSPSPSRRSARSIPQSSVLRMKLLNADRAAHAEALEPLAGKINYLLGADPRAWRVNLPTYARVRYASVYPGIDLVYYGNQRQLEYDFVVAPGADPRAIGLGFEGAERVEVDAQGDLVLRTAGGEVRQHKPVIYQEVNGERKEIAGGYVIAGVSRVCFQIGDYDASRPLVIDPVLVYSTYLGGSSGGGRDPLTDILGDFGSDIAVDASGAAYVTGFTFASDFPTERPVQGSNGGGNCDGGNCPDIFVAKLNAAGNALVYATYLGGDGVDTGGSIAVDGAGAAYVTGTTLSQNFPPNRDVMKLLDAIVVKLSADGSRLVYTYLLGGKGIDVGTGIAVDASGAAYITGSTFPASGANDFPLVKPLQGAPGGGVCTSNGESLPCPDAFVSKLNPEGSALVYSTYLGGNRFELGGGIAVDAAGAAYVTGTTASSNFPTRNAAQHSLASSGCSDPQFCFDAFVTKIAADGSATVYSTYLGGGNGSAKKLLEEPFAITEQGGATESPAAKAKGFIAAGFGAAQQAPQPIEISHGIAVDATGNAWVTGTTTSRDFPLRNPLRTTNPGAIAFVSKLDPAGALSFSTFLGGATAENSFNLLFSLLSFVGLGYSSNNIAVDMAGNAYVTGMTHSSDFPVSNPVQRNIGGGACGELPCPDAFVTKLSPAGAMVYSTFLGGRGKGDEGLFEVGLGIAADNTGNVYVTGVTSAANFPLAGPLQSIRRGSADLFVAKIGEQGGPPPAGTLASVSAANYLGPQLAPDSIVAAFGAGLATRVETAPSLPLPTNLAGTTVSVRDSLGTERPAPLFFVAPNQLNFLMPPGTPTGQATITVTSGAGQVSRGTAQIVSTAAGLFSADASGQGLASAVLLRIRASGEQVYEPVARFDQSLNRFVAVPIDFGPESDQLFLILFGTGMRFRTNAAVTIGGTAGAVLYVGPSVFVGLDQCNVNLPRSLAGRGEVNVAMTVDGRAVNTVRVSIR